MTAVLRALAGLGAALALVLTFAGSANAAAIKVKLANPAAPDKLLTAQPDNSVAMRGTASGVGQVWYKAGVSPGFAAFIAEDGQRCLTGRGSDAAPVVTLERCIRGLASQAWRTDADGTIILRANSLALEVTTPPIAQRVKLAPFTGLENQRWTQTVL